MVEESYEVAGERKLSDKLTALKNLAKSFEKKVSGFSYNTSNDKWSITGKALVGKASIDSMTGILLSFAEPVNLMTGKKDEKFIKEFTDAFFKTNVMLLNDETCSSKNYRVILKMFKDTMSNIGDIIVVSRETMKKTFENIENDSSSEETY